MTNIRGALPRGMRSAAPCRFNDRRFRPDLRRRPDRHVVRLRALRARADGGALAAGAGDAGATAPERAARRGRRARAARRGRRDRRHEAGRRERRRAPRRNPRSARATARAGVRARRGANGGRRAAGGADERRRGRGVAAARSVGGRNLDRMREAVLRARDESGAPRLRERVGRAVVREREASTHRGAAAGLCGSLGELAPP